MDSDEEVEDSEINEDDEFEGYDELEKLSSDLEETKLNSQKRDSLIREKLNLLLKFNANAEDKYTSNGELIPGMLIDPELYRIEINKINRKNDPYNGCVLFKKYEKNILINWHDVCSTNTLSFIYLSMLIGFFVGNLISILADVFGRKILIVIGLFTSGLGSIFIHILTFLRFRMVELV